MLETRHYYDFVPKDRSEDEVEHMLQLPFDREGWKNRLVVDLGCGIGRHARFWAQAGFRYLGLDSDLGLLEKAKELKSQYVGMQKCLFLQAALPDLDYWPRTNAEGASIVTAVGRLVHFLQAAGSPDEEKTPLQRLFESVAGILTREGVFIVDADLPWSTRFVSGLLASPDRRKVLMRRVAFVDLAVRYVMERFAECLPGPGGPSLREEFQTYSVRVVSEKELKDSAASAGLEFLHAEPGVGELSRLHIFIKP